MKHKYLFILIIISLAISIGSVYSEGQSSEPIMVLREAKESGTNSAAVEAKLIDDIMEVKITARIYGSKPRIYNALIVGPKLGRLSIESKEVLTQTPGEEAPYPTTERKAFISFAPSSKTKALKGTLTRELVRFKIPKDRIVRGKIYKLWVQIESMQSGGSYRTFEFELKNFAELILK
ncbi:MAG: hypothetical protein KKB22_02575 [Candidatus Omnitrophica bacterium]|nr:hypothetical protein [Candidatus Omnitrophota bacterium]